MFAISSEELNDLPQLSLEDEGRLIHCDVCGGKHPLNFGTEDGKKTIILGDIKCTKTGSSYLVAVGGKLLIGKYFEESVIDI